VSTEADACMACRLASIKSRLMAYWRRMLASDFVRKVAETFATRVFLIGIGLITSVIVARILGPEGRGLYAVAAAIAALGVQFGNLGLHASNTYYVAKDQSLLPALVGNTLVVSFAFGGGGAFAAWIVFSVWPDLSPVNGFLLIIAMVWVPFGLAYMLLQNLLLGLQEVRAYNKIELLHKILFVCITICIFLGGGQIRVETILSINLVILVISFAVVLWAIRKYFWEFPVPSLTLFRNNLNFGVKAYLASLIAFLVFKADLFLINYYLGAKYVGLYAVAVSVANMFNLLPETVGAIFFPKLCSMKDLNSRFKFAKKITIIMSIIMLFIALMLIAVSGGIITAFFGMAYANAAIPFKWLMPGFYFLSVEITLRRFLISDGYRTEIVLSWCITFVVNIVLNIFLIPIMGTKGAALALSISLALLATLTLFLVWRFVSHKGALPVVVK